MIEFSHGLVTRFGAADHPEGSTRKIYDFETGRELGEIPQPAHTFSTISHSNEHGVVIAGMCLLQRLRYWRSLTIDSLDGFAETTQGGLAALNQVGKDHTNGTIMDYGSLIVTTLQRASTAREAIHTMVSLCNTYGYASSMEGFSITDGKILSAIHDIKQPANSSALGTEAWYMELIGKGNWSNGVVWVALRVPDGYVTANANQVCLVVNDPSDTLARHG